MRYHDSQPSRIYTYSSRGPTDDLDRAMDQLRLAHHYKNKIIEIEQARRTAVDKAIRAEYPAVAGIEDELTAAQTALDGALAIVKAANSRARKRDTGPVDRAEVKRLRAEVKRLRAARKEARVVAFSDPAILEMTAKANEQLRAARAEFANRGLFWGSYLFIESSHNDIRKGAPPHFRHWTGEGTLAVQIQKGMDWEAVTLGSDSRLRLEILPRPAHADLTARRANTRIKALLWFRVGSAGPGNRQPIWVRIPLCLHRVPPPGTQVKWARVRRQIIGTRPVWTVQFVLSRADDWEKPDTAQAGTCGVDINWRSLPQGLRVAYLVGDDGVEDSLFVPRDWINRWTKAESLQAIRDREFNSARNRFRDWLKAHVAIVPDWFRENTENVHLWKYLGRLTRLIWQWKDNRFPGDEEIFADLWGWRRQENHLHNWQDNQEAKAVRCRDQLYREWAARVRRRYGTVILEDIDYRELHKSALAEDPANDLIRLYADIAAPGRLARFLREAAGRFVLADPVNTTRRCPNPECGKVDDFDRRKLRHICSGCGEDWDQDRKAALNLLRAAVEPEPEPVGIGG